MTKEEAIQASPVKVAVLSLGAIEYRATDDGNILRILAGEPEEEVHETLAMRIDNRWQAADGKGGLLPR